jgi:hypothetical protein
VSFSKESRYRNIVSTGEYEEKRSAPPTLIVGAIAIFLIICCGCGGLFAGLKAGGGIDTLTSGVSLPVGQPGPTPTLDRNASVPLRQPGAMDNGLEMTVQNVQRPLKVQGGITLTTDQQFILVTIQITNTKKTGAAIRVAPTDFQVKGDGGLAYDSNPKAVTIPSLLNETTVAPGKRIDAELIYQIAVDDSGLKLLWKAGSQTRTFMLEK